MKKQYLLDTSIILSSLEVIESLSENNKNQLFITNIVLKELDGHKEDMLNDKGYFARNFIRNLDRGLLKDNVNCEEIKPLKNDYIHCFVYKTKEDKEVLIYLINREVYEKDINNDYKILEIAKDYNFELLTNDLNLKITAIAKGIKASSIQKDIVEHPENIDFTETIFYKKENLEKQKVQASREHKKWTCFIFKEKNKNVETGVQKFYINMGNYLEEIKEEDFDKSIVKPLNIEQKFYIKLLKSNYSILTVTGSTGSGKTLLAVSEAINIVKDKNNPIDGIVYLRNTVTANDKAAELGYRKGSEEQKLSYFAYPLNNALSFIGKVLFKNGSLEDYKGSGSNEAVIELMKKYNIEIFDIAHARGTTIENKIVIFDELQNASNDTLKLIGTRIGKNSKLILMGDFKQVDHPYLTKNRNALVTMLKKSKEYNILAAIQLRKTIRSEIADWFDNNI